jgi:hypothetical protein
VAGPKSPTRISAKNAAIPSAFVAEPDLVAFYTLLTMKERDNVKIRILIGRLSAALLDKRYDKVVLVLDKLAIELLPLTIVKDPRAGAKKKSLDTLKRKYTML